MLLEGRPGHKWEDNINMDIRGAGCEDVGGLNVADFCEHGDIFTAS
jgi:hypothetical protein